VFEAPGKSERIEQSVDIATLPALGMFQEKKPCALSNMQYDCASEEEWAAPKTRVSPKAGDAERHE